MQLSVEQFQIFYEIALSIGTSFDLDAMAKEGLRAYLRKLNCSAGTLLQGKPLEGGAYTFEHVYSLPKIVTINRAYQQADALLSALRTSEDAARFKEKLPFSIHGDADEHVHFMELPDFGLLVLVKNGEDIDPYTIKSLTPLNKKLADSARACLQKTALETSEKQLVAAHQRLQTLDEEKTTFLTYLTHEMNTPLNWIGAAELLDREELSDDNLEFIEIVDKGFKRLTDLIRAALSYFDLAGSPIPLALADVSLSHTVCDVLTANNEILTARRLAVTTDFCDADVIQADPNHLRDVVTILVDNAMAFSEPGASIAIDTARREGSLTLTITDHGKGIDPNDLPNIFKPFTMAEHKRSEGGYGFNLPKAQRLCDAHGWTIKALSEGRGHGARFVVDFITHANAAP